MTSPASKFRKSAQSLQSKIDHKRAPRLTNTAKRMREWESAIQDALHMEKLQDKLNALADAWDNITLPVELSTLKDVAQVEYLLFQERPPTNTTTDSYARMQRAELLDADVYLKARNALLSMGDERAGQEDRSIQLKRAEMDVDNSRISGYFPTPEAVIQRMLEQVEMLTEPEGISETIIRDLEEAINLMKQVNDANKREATDAWLKAVNDTARELDELTYANRHKSNADHQVILDASPDQLQKADVSSGAIRYNELHNQYKELAKADPVEWYKQQEKQPEFQVGDKVIAKDWRWTGIIESIELRDGTYHYIGKIVKYHSGTEASVGFSYSEKFLEPTSPKEITTIKEETPNPPRKQVQNTPVDEVKNEAPRLRQLEMF